MLTIFLYALVLLFVLLLVLVIFAISKPGEFSIRRSISIHARPVRVYGLIEDFRNWPKWSPWEKLDPSMHKSLSGADIGKGAIYAWEGNKKVGAGRMEILEAAPVSRVVIKLEFLRPFAAENLTTFSLVPAGDGTNVTWEMSGNNALMFRIMGVLMNMDKMVGRDFEKGLAAMKAEAESAATPA